MAKGVLGNDPFQRGAASRAQSPAPSPADPVTTTAPEGPPLRAKAKPADKPKKVARTKKKTPAVAKAPSKKTTKAAAAKKTNGKASTRGRGKGAVGTRSEDHGASLHEDARSEVPVEVAGLGSAAVDSDERVRAEAPASAFDESVEIGGIGQAAFGAEGMDDDAPVDEASAVAEPLDGDDALAEVGGVDQALDGADPARVETQDEDPERVQALRSDAPVAEAEPLRDGEVGAFRDTGAGAWSQRLRERARADAAPLTPLPENAGAREVLTTGGVSAWLRGGVELVRAMLGRSPEKALDPYGRDGSLLESLRPLTRFLYERYFRVTVRGTEHLPRGASLLVANHSGAIPYDGPVLAAAVKHERPELPDVRWLVEDSIFHAPFIGMLLNRLGALRASPQNALELLDKDQPVIVFPEGAQGLSKPYHARYQLQRLGRGGFAKIALKTGVPIVPVAIIGAEETTPLLAKLPGGPFGFAYLPVTPLGPLPLPARWHISFGAPIPPPRIADGAELPNEEVERLATQTRTALEAMLRDGLAARTSVFF
jgi:1-acyl-sn-glycerol-3-phosphate acyltransferase